MRPSSEDPAGLREMQSRLFQAERMASLGVLASGIAHEVNNPLTYVLANLGYIVEQMEARAEGMSATDVELLAAARDAYEGAERVRGVIRDMHTLARGDTDKIGPTDVHVALDTAIRVTSHAMRRRATVQRVYANVPFVIANEGLLVQAFMNLLLNAAQSMGEVSGKVLVTTKSFGSGVVLVEIQDDGEGIDRVHRARIFEPFFTTRAASGATGLGLYTVQGIVSTLHGRVDFDSAPAQGTTFRVTLPASTPSDTEELPNTRVARPLRVLLVDDEPQVRGALARMLTDHEITFCTDAQHALEMCRSASFDVLLSDLVMPGLSGREMHEIMMQEGNPLAVHTVFLTGGALDPEDARYIQSGRCLYKPVTREALLAAIEEAAR